MLELVHRAASMAVDCASYFLCLPPMCLKTTEHLYFCATGIVRPWAFKREALSCQSNSLLSQPQTICKVSSCFTHSSVHTRVLCEPRAQAQNNFKPAELGNKWQTIVFTAVHLAWMLNAGVTGMYQTS